MAGNIIRDAVIIGGIAVATVMVVSNKEQVYEMIGVTPPADQTVVGSDHSAQTAPVSQTQNKPRGVAVSIPKSQRDGQYWTEATVNGGFVKFLVDTGASSVALTPEDARKAGIRLDRLEYNIPISTAGGDNVAARVILDRVAIGAVSVRNVDALVVPEGLSTSLLGMTYLGQLQKVEVTPNALLLRL